MIFYFVQKTILSILKPYQIKFYLMFVIWQYYVTYCYCIENPHINLNHTTLKLNYPMLNSEVSIRLEHVKLIFIFSGNIITLLFVFFLFTAKCITRRSFTIFQFKPQISTNFEKAYQQ